MQQNHILTKINAATNDLLIDPDWALNLDICDAVSRDIHLGEQTIKIIKTRLKHKHPKVGVLAIQLLEALIKNCPNFHPHVASEEFMHTLVKLTKTKPEKKSLLKRLGSSEVLNYEENERIDRTLILIQSLGTSFANSSTFPIFKRTYQNLLRHGVRFPVPLKDEGAPIFTPPAKYVAASPRADLKCSGNYVDPTFKTHHDNALLLFEILDQSDPQEDLKKNEIINTLVHSCRSKQAEGIRSLQGNLSETKLSDTLALNDVLLQVLTYFDNLAIGKVSRKSTKPVTKKTKNERSDSESAPSDNDGDESEVSSEEEDLNDDFLGLGLDSSPTVKSKVKSSKSQKRVKKKKNKHIVPVLDPPKSAVHSQKTPENQSKIHSTEGAIDIVDDILDLTKNKIENDFFSFDNSATTTEIKPKTENNSGYDFDEFFDIASRHEQPVTQNRIDEPNPFEVSDDLLPSNQSNQQSQSQPTNNDQQLNEQKNPFDPLF